MAATYDGSAPLLCALGTVLECERNSDCQRRTAEEISLPYFVRINTQQKNLSAADGSGSTTPIERVEHLDGRLLLQGGEVGKGWSIVITEATGSMSAAIVEDTGSFVIFGACTTP
jgi:hypothetical protein